MHLSGNNLHGVLSYYNDTYGNKPFKRKLIIDEQSILLTYVVDAILKNMRYIATEWFLNNITNIKPVMAECDSKSNILKKEHLSKLMPLYYIFEQTEEHYNNKFEAHNPVHEKIKDILRHVDNIKKYVYAHNHSSVLEVAKVLGVENSQDYWKSSIYDLNNNLMPQIEMPIF